MSLMWIIGLKNGREHYHAVVVPKNGNLELKQWHSYGAIKCERIRYKDNSEKRLATYISKLTNHAIKHTAKQNRIIYSRN